MDFANTDDNWAGEVNALRAIGLENGVPMLVERSRSGKGAHVWMFFDTPVAAALVRRFGVALLEKGAESVNMTSFRFYDRMLPAQNYLEEGELGNLIALPLQGKSLMNGNSAFVDENWNAYPNQWTILQSVQKLSVGRIEELLRQWNVQSEDDMDANMHISQGDDLPWERGKRFHSEDVRGKLNITLSNMIYIKNGNLQPRIQNQLRRMAAVNNPIFFRNNAMGLSNYANPRYIYLGEDVSGFICIPRGLLDRLLEHCKEANINYTISDKRCGGVDIHADFIGELKDNQNKAANILLRFDNGILSAATAFGKTVVCSAMIARKKVNTLILLESSSLIEQWEKSLTTFLSIEEDLPEYKTKTERSKKRKSLVGIIQGAKDTSTGIVDIARQGL